ncbi:hypothetical protein EOS_35965 [Caballeronia mineralivorans PML1(12)]|uniref:Uncharacterized protein n=2 Tax=Caballeronia mineralivorans TaxID=2010198 RepID=A0A0J1CM03_9BURK|nr:hypothetical protein EOS_35965 [Caballeronia mineralivorans PML1(12)]
MAGSIETTITDLVGTTMRTSQSPSSSLGTSSGFRLYADTPASNPNPNDGEAGTLDDLFAELDGLFTRGATDAKVHEYLRASLGLESACGNDYFCSAVLRLGGSSHPATSIENHRVNCALMNLAARVYSGQEKGQAFLEGGRLNWDGFIWFVAGCLRSTIDQVLAMMPPEREEGISLQGVDPCSGASGAEAIEATGTNGDAERLQNDGPNRFEQLPPEVLQNLFGFLCKSRDLVNAATTSRGMCGILRAPVKAHQLVHQATQIRSRSDVRKLTGDDGHGAIGDLGTRHQATVLSTMIGKLPGLPAEERLASFKKVLAATLRLPQRCQAPLLVALTGKMRALGSGARGAVFDKLINAVSTLSDDASFKVLAALAGAIWMLPPHKTDTGFHRLLSAVDALRCRNAARPPALPLNDMCAVLGRFPDEARVNAWGAFFELFDALPHDVRAAALVKMASGLQDHFQNVESIFFMVLLTEIEKLPLVHRLEPLTALSDWIGVIPDKDVVFATKCIIASVDRLRNGRGVPPALFSALLTTLARQPLAGKDVLVTWLVAVTGEVHRDDPGRLGALPLVQLGAAFGMLSCEARRSGIKDYFGVFNALPDAQRERLLIELATEIDNDWMDSLMLGAFLDAVWQLPAGCNAKPLSEAINRIAWLSATDAEIRLATDCILEFIKKLRVSGSELSAGLFDSLGKLYWAQPESDKAATFSRLTIVVADFFRRNPNGRDISPAHLLGRMYDGLPDEIRAVALARLLAFAGRLPDGIHARILTGMSRGASRMLQGTDAKQAFPGMLQAIKSIAFSDQAPPLAALIRRVVRLPSAQVGDRVGSIFKVARNLGVEHELSVDLLTAMVELLFMQLDDSRDGLFAWLRFTFRNMCVSNPERLKAFPTRPLGLMLISLPDGMRARALKDLLSLTDELPGAVRARTLATVLHGEGLLFQGVNRQSMLNDVLHVIDRLPTEDRGSPLTALSREIRYLPLAELADATGRIMQVVEAFRRHAPVSRGLFSALVGLLAKHPKDRRQRLLDQLLAAASAPPQNNEALLGALRELFATLIQLPDDVQGDSMQRLFDFVSLCPSAVRDRFLGGLPHSQIKYG